jgi:hypothetical protein
MADAVLLLAEPPGSAGFNPTGHVGVYLTRVCAASPTRLRPCEPGEIGAVIGRYNGIAGLDWAATPLIPYLYAVERASDTPATANPEGVAALRQAYRRSWMPHLVPDAPESADAPQGPWTQLAGAAYSRRIVAFRVATTPEQDAELIQELNSLPNTSRFNPVLRNCADFARDLINRYYPGALRRSLLADFGITTPKQVARTLVRHSRTRPQMDLSVFVIPQIPGSARDSRRTRGISESLVKGKRYALPLLAVQPWVSAGLATGYVMSGRFNPDRLASATYEPSALEAYVRQHARAD